MLSAKHCLYLGVRKTLDSCSRTTLTPDPSRPPSISRRPLRPSSPTVVRSQLAPHLSPRPSQAPRPSLAPSVVPPASSNSPVSKRQRKPSAALLEAVSAQKKQKRRHDPETAALLANCNVPFEDQEQEPPKKAPKKASQKATKKPEVNKSFFTALPRAVTVLRGTYRFLPMLMGKEPLANSTTFNITRSNVNIEHNQ